MYYIVVYYMMYMYGNVHIDIDKVLTQLYSY